MLFRSVGSMHIPECDARVVVKFETMQGKLAISDDGIEIVTTTQRTKRIETCIGWQTIPTLSRKDTMNDIWKLAYGVELEMTRGFLLLCNQNGEPFLLSYWYLIIIFYHT